MRPLLLFTALLVNSAGAMATPFDTCPSKAYLFQSQPVQVYGVNLVTGSTALLQGDTGTTGNVNGVGFDFDSRYIFGYNTTDKTIVRMGKDFQVEVLSVSGLPTDHTFYVGDVFNKYYYLYRTGKGLFRIDLTPLDTDPDATLIVEQLSTTATVRLTDFAFHPVNSKLYGIDNNSGWLYEFDPQTGAETLIGDTGELGTFGAGYFDVNGYYYVSRNQDGQIYRIDLSDESQINSGVVPAVKFADGPSSNQNDGARCANAPVVDEDSNIDFGDAPDSYSTTLASNGPRHELDQLTWLGDSAPDGEQDGLVAPLSDDTVGIDDDNGVEFITTLQTGLDAMIQVNASTQGYLSSWFDWNQDGDFLDEGEQLHQDLQLSEGNNNLIFTVPLNAVQGSSWSRFRFSQQTGLAATGGATSGEVEDHQIFVTAEGITVRHYPNESGYATVAFEDNWPHKADYDMNDVVIHYRVTEILKDNLVQKSFIRGRLAAYGADYHSGFAIRLAGLSQSDIDTSLTRQFHNDQLQADSGLEMDSAEAIFRISDDLSHKKGTECRFFRTLSDCKENESFMFELHVSLNSGADSSGLMAMPYDPFVFATPYYYHGEELPLHPGRTLEIHLADQAPTEKFNRDELWNLGVDASDESTDTYFKTANNLPWALLVPYEWQWPIERKELTLAYPMFAEFAESAGESAKQWYLPENAVAGNIYQP
ncbi:LruC domain-containing protein [Vibrio sp. SCSIO 43137]|uniref:LruC domain-containing protein n=1 Tax=Vibrio sp. SCSIO 43137 TaxID=3021011 RepID=UPI0023074161|nr:LruC domain-containing protein [Vibrio sp. SCSIO 43137]WCE31978.1 LruC domain-containing protein [Vibrio sp. SCSIO 43137]